MDTNPAPVEFNEPSGAQKSAANGTALSRLIIKMGLAKDQKGAQTIMIIVTVITLVVTVLVWMFLMPQGPVVAPEPLITQ